jgi:hypothetical protein
LRAPDDENSTFTRNPYRKEKIIKKLFGKTKEERVKYQKELIQQHLERKEGIDKAEIE